MGNGTKTVVVDFEMCRVPKQLQKESRLKNEIIQIGAVLLDENMETLSTFSCYVRPQFGWTDSYISRLTGINARQLSAAPMFVEAKEKFFNWIPEGEVTMVSWSKSDLVQLFRELGAKKIANDRSRDVLSCWVDCQAMFSERLKTKRAYSLTEALVASDIPWKGRAHDGMDDAYNTALLYAKLIKEGDEFRLNSYYEAACNEEESESLRFTLGEIFKNLNLQCVAT